MTKLKLFRFKHRESATIFYGHGLTPREAANDLHLILFKRPTVNSPAFIKERYEHLVKVGLIAPPARPNVKKEDWIISQVAAAVTNNHHLAIVDEIQKMADKEIKILNVPRALRRSDYR